MHKGQNFAKFTAAVRRSEFRKNLREIPTWGKSHPDPPLTLFFTSDVLVRTLFASRLNRARRPWHEARTSVGALSRHTAVWQDARPGLDWLYSGANRAAIETRRKP